MTSSLPWIFVCGLEEMPGYVERLQPRRLISVVPPEDQPETPPGVRADDHLRVEIHDILGPEDGAIHCEREHIESLVRFLRESDPDASLLIHCMAGVSRSPAAALIALAVDAPGRECENAERLRQVAAFARPNALMITLADLVLGRGGRLVDALDAMGPCDPIADFGLIALPRRPERVGAGNGGRRAASR